jgi:hypothetical protein
MSIMNCGPMHCYSVPASYCFCNVFCSHTNACSVLRIVKYLWSIHCYQTITRGVESPLNKLRRFVSVIYFDLFRLGIHILWKIWFWELLQKFVETFKFCLNSDRNNGQTKILFPCCGTQKLITVCTTAWYVRSLSSISLRATFYVDELLAPSPTTGNSVAEMRDMKNMYRILFVKRGRKSPFARPKF